MTPVADTHYTRLTLDLTCRVGEGEKGEEILSWSFTPLILISTTKVDTDSFDTPTGYDTSRDRPDSTKTAVQDLAMSSFNIPASTLWSKASTKTSIA